MIFFADPTLPQDGNADLQALTRLAVVHDIPVVQSPSGADMISAALLRAMPPPEG